jgi:hypothetical protein
MEQEFLFISKNYTELFKIKTDYVDENLFKQNTNNKLKDIVKKHDVVNNFKLVNLYNGIDKKYKLKGKNDLYGGNHQINAENKFQNDWNLLSSYVQNTLDKNINVNRLKNLYDDFVVSGTNYKIHQDELKMMFVNLLNINKANYQNIQIGGEDQNQIIPVIDQLTEQPITNQLTEQPITNQLTEQPVTNQLTEQPVTNQLTEQPVTNQLTEQPITNQLTEQPITNQLTEQPVTNQLTEQLSITNTIINQPVKDTLTNQLLIIKPPLSNVPTKKQLSLNMPANNLVNMELINISAKNLNEKISCPVQ